MGKNIFHGPLTLRPGGTAAYSLQPLHGRSLRSSSVRGAMDAVIIRAPRVHSVVTSLGHRHFLVAWPGCLTRPHVLTSAGDWPRAPSQGLACSRFTYLSPSLFLLRPVFAIACANCHASRAARWLVSAFSVSVVSTAPAASVATAGSCRSRQNTI